MRNMWAAVFFALLTVSTAIAAMPQTISYQGYLKDGVSGAPVSSQVTLTFRLYDSLQAASPVWLEVLEVTPQNGIYSVQLGTNTPLESSLLASTALYLGLQVGSNPELTPRQQILSVPFAMRAASADSVNPATIVIDASQITTGTLATERLPASAAKLDTVQAFSANQTFQDQTLNLRNSANTFSTALRANNATAARTMTLPDASGTVITTGNLSGISGNLSGITGVGTITSGSWNGSLADNIVSTASIQNGAVTAAKISGTLPVANGGTGLAVMGSSGQVLTSNGSSLAWTTPSNSGGTVSSVAVSGGTTGLTTSGGPITGSGTVTLGGVLGIGNGGTGATSQTTALTSLLPSQSGNAGKLLGTNGSAASWMVADPGFGTGTNTAAAGNSVIDCVLGQVMLFAGNVGMGLPADGRTLLISQYPGLYAVLGTRFGGNGTTSFALPNLSNAAPNGLTYMICTEGIFPSRY